jgi:metallo-beta-lactamase class B/metallo-beta-lactamase class B GIM
MLAATSAAHANENLPKFEIKSIYKNVYLHKSYKQVENFGLVSSNGLVLIDGVNAFIVDTPWTEEDTKRLFFWIKEKGYKLVGSVSTHSHEDRTGGIKWLNSQSVPTYASKLTNEFLEKQHKELASHPFTGPEFKLFNGKIEAYFPGAGHSMDNIVIWLPGPKILFGGCLVRSQEATDLGYTAEGRISEWPKSIERLVSRYSHAKMLVPGHGEIGDIGMLKHTKELAESASQLN